MCDVRGGIRGRPEALHIMVPGGVCVGGREGGDKNCQGLKVWVNRHKREVGCVSFPLQVGSSFT